jgi:hypothetical protein
MIRATVVWTGLAAVSLLSWAIVLMLARQVVRHLS